MARKPKVTRIQLDALLKILEDIEVKLPIGRFITVSEDGDEESYEIEEFDGIEVSIIEVVIDEAVSKFQEAKVFPKRKKGTFSLSDLFELFLDDENPIVDLAVELETALSGYRDLIREDDIEIATELIGEIRDGIAEEIKKNADLAK